MASAAAVEPPLWLAFCAGSCGGLCNVVSGHPLDTVKVRIQTGNTQHLFRGLFNGILAPVSTAVPFWAVMYTGYKAGRAMQPDDSAASKARAGAFAGLCGSVVWCPMQAVKCVAQDSRCSTLSALRIVLDRAGVRGLYRGYTPTVLLFSVPGSAAFYWTYETSRERFGHSWWVPFAAGGMAGCVEWAVGMPGDTIRVRYQTGMRYPNVRACVRDLWGSDGLRGMFRGFSAAQVRAFIANGSALVGIEAVNTIYCGWRQ